MANIKLPAVSLRNTKQGAVAMPDAPIPITDTPAPRALLPAILAIVLPAALVAAIYAAVGRLGAPSADEGLLQAYSYRILQGQVPHRDFIAPTPLGSALLHVIDFAIPGPLFEVSRVIALGEYVAYATLFAWLILERAPWRWGLVMSLGTALSVLVNLNVFPIMSWYTVDGLVFLAAGFLVITYGVRRDSWRTILAGFFVVGLAALAKQSYVPAPAFAWLVLVPRLAGLPWAARVRALIGTGIVAALPSVAYLAVVAALGGLDEMLRQLFSAGLVYGRPLVAAWSPHHDLVVLGPLFAAAALLAAGIERLRRQAEGSSVLLVLRVGLTAVLLGVPLVAQLGYAGGDQWGIRVLWMVAACWGVRAIANRSIDAVGLVLLGTAWMTSLSIGYAYPNFVAGTLIGYALHRAWIGARVPVPRFRPAFRAAPAAASVLLLALFAYLFVSVRMLDVYGDRPATDLTVTLQQVSPAFGDIRTTPEMEQYLRQMRDCIRNHPARYVAVLPENTAMYPALSLNNPFPIDWMWPDAMHGSVPRINAATDWLNSHGDYLVLFLTVATAQVASGSPVPAATPDTPVYAYSSVTADLPYTSLPAKIYSQLKGERLTCGSFLAVYSPAGE